jgi:hypothetical protein
MEYDLTFQDYGARVREFIQRTAERCHDAPLTDQTDVEFNELAQSLFALQFAQNAPYRRFCQARKVVPESVSTWTQVPPVPASAFKELEMSSLSPHERTTVFYSSGTTDDRPSRHFHNAESLALYEASLIPWFRRHVFAGAEKVGQAFHLVHPDLSDKIDGPRERPALLCILTPPPADAPHSSLVHMFETVRREFGTTGSVFTGAVSDGVWILDLTQTVSTLHQAVSINRPIAILGTAFSFVHLLDHCSARGIRFALPSGSRALETGGYKGRSRSLSKKELHEFIADFLGLPASHIVREYGMTELSSQAYDQTVPSCELRVPGSRGETLAGTPNTQHARRVFRFPAWARVQISSPETGREVTEGETGLIRVYDLANVRSVMAIQTEDLGIRRGNGFELLGRAAAAEPRGCSLMTA